MGGKSSCFLSDTIWGESQFVRWELSLESIHNATAETVGCPFENMASYSEDFTVATRVQERWLLLVTSNVGHV